MNKKIILLTGCSSGIGESLVLSLSSYPNVKIYATARNLSSISQLEKENVKLLELDVCNKVSIKNAVDHIIDFEGRIDILINNAGINIYGPTLDLTEEESRKVMDTNFWGVVNVVNEVSKYMMISKSGLIANVGSPGGWVACPFIGMYSASKAALHSWTDTLRMELAPFNIQVSLIVPGAIKSDIVIKAQGHIPGLLDRTRYHQIKEYILKRSNSSQGHSMTGKQFADYAAAQILKPSGCPTKFSYGPLTTTYTIYSYLPNFITDYIFSRDLGLLRLREILTIEGKNKAV